MQYTLIFSDSKRKILEFHADEMDFERQSESILISVEGVMAFQDTPALEDLTSSGAPCHISLLKNGDVMMEGKFLATFFVLEADHITVSLG